MMGHPNLWGWWRFESDGVDSSGNNRDLTAYSTTQSIQSGKIGNCANMYYNSTTNRCFYRNLSPTITTSKKMTFALWAKPIVLNAPGVALRLYSGSTPSYTLMFQNGYLQANWSSSTNNWWVRSTNTSGLTAENWVHIINVIDLSTYPTDKRHELYFNGILQTSTNQAEAGTPTSISGINLLEVGGVYDAVNRCAQVDEVMIYYGLACNASDAKRIYAGLHPLGRA